MKSLLCLLFRTPVAPTWASGGTVNKQTREFTQTTHIYTVYSEESGFDWAVANGLTFSGPSLTQNITEYESLNNKLFLFCFFVLHTIKIQNTLFLQLWQNQGCGIPYILPERGNMALLCTQRCINNGFSITADSVPATCWSNHTQVEPAWVTQVCRHGHSICQQTNQWKGWTPSLSEGVMDVGGRGGDVFAQPQQGDTGPQNWKKKKIAILNVGGWKYTTLEEVKEALLPSTHTLLEHVGVWC